MKKFNLNTSRYYTPYQLILPLNLEILLENNDIVFTFLEIVSNIDLKKYLCKPLKFKGRLGYDTLDLLKVILFGFSLDGYVSLRKLESYCKNDIRFMYLMKGLKPSHMTFSNFINNYLADNIENIFLEINNYIFEKDKVDLNHLYLDGSKFEANANKYTWVWKNCCLTNREKLFNKITKLFEDINNNILNIQGITFSTREEYAIEYLEEKLQFLKNYFNIDTATFVKGRGHSKSQLQRYYEILSKYIDKLKEYAMHIKIAGEDRNSYSKTDKGATFMRIKTDYMGNDQLLPAYNVQLGICDEYIAVPQVFHYASDMDTFIPVMERFNKYYGKYPKYPVADAGYGSFNNYIYCEEHNMEKYMKFTMYKKTVEDKKYRENRYRVENFKIENGNMYCPNGKKFIYQYNSQVKGNKYGRTYEVYKCESCDGCPYKEKCTKANGDRYIKLNRELNAYYEEVLCNLESIQGVLLRENRSIQAEGTFGIIKYDRWYKRLVRREKLVELEIFLVSIGYNIYKYHNKKYRVYE